MTPDFRASEADPINLTIGRTVTLESLRQSAVPPFVMIAPFIEPSGGIQVIGQTALDEDGVHGYVCTRKALQSGHGTVRVRFRDLRTGEVVKEWTVRLRASDRARGRPST